MYIIIEIQKNGDTAALTPAKVFNAEADAWQEYYTSLAYAVKSTVEKHSVLMLTGDGKIIAANTFNH